MNDPFENYHLLSFLKLLLSDNGDNFQNKLVLQSAHKNCLRYRDSLLGELLQDASGYWGDFNLWRSSEQLKIVEGYLYKVGEGDLSNHVETAKALLKRAAVLSE